MVIPKKNKDRSFDTGEFIKAEYLLINMKLEHIISNNCFLENAFFKRYTIFLPEIWLTDWLLRKRTLVTSILERKLPFWCQCQIWQFLISAGLFVVKIKGENDRRNCPKYHKNFQILVPDMHQRGGAVQTGGAGGDPARRLHARARAARHKHVPHPGVPWGRYSPFPC